MNFQGTLDRLITPLNDVLAYTGIRHDCHPYTVNYVLRETARRCRSIWGWTKDEWVETINTHQYHRQHVVAAAYLLCEFSDVHRLNGDRVMYIILARKIFGVDYVLQLLHRVRQSLTDWSYVHRATRNHVCRLLCQAMLQNRSPHLEDLRLEFLEQVARTTTDDCRRSVVALACVLNSLIGLEVPRDLLKRAMNKAVRPPTTEKVPNQWAAACERWFRTSTLSLTARRHTYYIVLKIGRWLGQNHPDMTSPDGWSRDFASQAVATIFHLRCGDWTDTRPELVQNFGKPLAAATRASYISALRTFFRDLQEWETIPRRFDPARAFTTPRSLLALIGPRSRVIADDIWAKLLWAGLNLTANELPKRRGKMQRSHYPIEMIRGIVITWLFAALRMNEILRLRLGCIRWQRDEITMPETGEPLPSDSVCFIAVPVSKTSTEYTKPVDRVVGEAIAVWEKIRPPKEKRLDPKTGELVDFLFSCGPTRVGKGYLNEKLIPILCRKAGVPTSDVRGRITSHRARSTIASQLFNAKEPMSLFDLQQFLGHSSPSSTQRYIQITPTKLAKAYADAGYFARNIRTVEVLIDQDAVRSGKASEEPWKFYDLGHGYCTNDFFEQCPFRMACAKCDFYVPKDSSQAQLIEARTHLLRLRQDIPLNDEELAAVEEGITAYERLLLKLADVPTPAGPTFRQIKAAELVQITPVQQSARPTRAT